MAEKLIPKDHRFGEKRPPFVTGYYEAFNQPNVSLVDLRQTPIVRVTERGIETAEGERPFDIVVWATGFDFGTGRAHCAWGSAAATAWRWRTTGPTARRTFLGVQTTGFPNLFFPGGPHAAAGNNPRYNGDQVDFITDAITYVRDHGYDVIEVDAGGRGASGRPWSTGARLSRPSGRRATSSAPTSPGSLASTS